MSCLALVHIIVTLSCDITQCAKLFGLNYSKHSDYTLLLMPSTKGTYIYGDDGVLIVKTYNFS